MEHYALPSKFTYLITTIVRNKYSVEFKKPMILGSKFNHIGFVSLTTVNVGDVYAFLLLS